MLAYLELFGICLGILYLAEIGRKKAYRDMGPPVSCSRWPSAVSPSDVDDFLAGWNWGRFHALSGRGPLFNSFRSSPAELSGYAQGFYKPEASWWA